MFPHTITVFNVIRNLEGITYHRQEVKNVFYHINKVISQEGKGEVYVNAYDVIFSFLALQNWVSKETFDGSPNTYTLKNNDIIVLGECNDIGDINELKRMNKDFFFIKVIHENLYGDNELQNIEVTN